MTRTAFLCLMSAALLALGAWSQCRAQDLIFQRTASALQSQARANVWWTDGGCDEGAAGQINNDGPGGILTTSSAAVSSEVPNVGGDVAVSASGSASLNPDGQSVAAISGSHSAGWTAEDYAELTYAVVVTARHRILSTSTYEIVSQSNATGTTTITGSLTLQVQRNATGAGDDANLFQVGLAQGGTTLSTFRLFGTVSMNLKREVIWLGRISTGRSMAASSVFISNSCRM